MPDPTPAAEPTPQATPATADATFLARTSAQSDDATIAAYLAAHPDRAKAYGVGQPAPQAVPTTATPAPTAGTPPQAAPAPRSMAERSTGLITPPQTGSGILGGLLQGANVAPGLAKPHAPAWQQPPLPPGVPTAAQEALQQPAVDPTMVIGGGVAGGVEGGLMAGAKAATTTGIAMEVQDAASRVTGMATDNPYIKGFVGLVAPIVLSILARRGISAVGGGAEPSAAPVTEAAPETYPQGTVLDAQGQPVTSAPAAAPEAVPAAGGEPGPAPEVMPEPAAIPEDRIDPGTGKPLWHLTQEEADAGAQAARTKERSDLVSVLGSEEKADEYDRLYRQQESTNDARANAASEKIAEIEKNWTPEQQRLVFGERGKGAPLAYEYHSFSDALAQLDDESPQALGQSLKYALTNVGRETDPAKMTDSQQVAYAQLRTAFQIAQDKGFDPAEVSDAAVKASASRFSDPADAQYMLQRFLKTGSGEVPPETGTPSGAGGAPPALPPPEDFSTPGGAAQTLAEKQLAALKTARVGENVATEFGRPDIATRVPIEQTIAEGQALRHTVEMPAEPGAEQPELAAHTAAHAGVYQDESNAIRAEASRIRAAQEAGQDTTADKEALANRFSAYAINYSNMAGMRSDVGRSLQILDPLKPENILATETAKLAQTIDPNDVDTLVDKLSKITYATHGDLAEMRAEATRISTAEKAGQDMTADKAALGERWKNSVTRTPAAVAEPEKPSGFAWTDSPGGPLRPAGQWSKQWADKLAADTARLRGELSPDDVDTLVDKLSKLEPEQQAAMARQIGTAAQEGQTIGGRIRGYFYNGLLSRPTTVVKKVFGDLTSWSMNSPTRALAARIPVWWGSVPKVAVGEGNEFAYGSIAAYEDALRVVGNTWGAGTSAIDLLGGGSGAGNLEPLMAGAAGDRGLMDVGANLLGDVARMPVRTIIAEHEFPRFVSWRGEARALSLRQATHEANLQGLTGEEAGNFIAQRTNELADNMPPDLFAAVHAAADRDVFSQPLGQFGQTVSKAFDLVPGLGRFLAPFRKIPVNLGKWAMSYTPVPMVVGAPGAAANLAGRMLGADADGVAMGRLLNSFYTDMQAGGAPAQLALAKLGLGSAGMGAIMMAHMDGLITDGGPSDPKLYHDQIATGWKPYSFHVFGHYYGFQNLEPLGQYIGLAADFHAIRSYMPERDVGHAAIAASMALARNMSRQSYVELMANFVRLTDKLRSGKGMAEALDEFGENELSGIIPAAIRAEAKREDPVMRDTRGMFNTFLSKIPGYSHTLPPMTDALAHPILTPPGFLANEVYPFQINSDKHDPIADETFRLGASPEKAPQLLPGSGTAAPSMMNPPGPDHPNVGIPLGPWDQYNWMKLRASIRDDEGPDGKTMNGGTPTGKTLEESLTELLHDPEYQGRSREDQKDEWERRWTNYGHMATLQMNQRPDLKRQLAQRQEWKYLTHMQPGQDPNTFLRQNGITPMSEGGDLP